MKLLDGHAGRGLVIVNLVLALVALTSAFAAHGSARFDELSVERLNVVEPDGQVRMVLANRERTPGPIERGKPFGYGPGERTGMIFYNDEETEAGGLIFSGKTEGDDPTAVGSLTFDQYNRDQTIALQYVENDGRRRAGLAISDYSTNVTNAEWSAEYERIRAMTDTAARRKAMARWRENGGRLRVFVGRRFNGDAAVILADAQGRSRLRLVVDSAGTAAIEFLGDSGKVVRRIGAEE